MLVWSPGVRKPQLCFNIIVTNFRDENDNDGDNWFGSWYPQLPRDLTVGDVVDKTSAHCHILAPLQSYFTVLPFDWYFDNTQ